MISHLTSPSSTQNIFAVGQPGTGKTVGIIIAMLNNIIQSNHQTQSLMFCATFDAAFQIFEYASEFIYEAGMNIELGLASKDVTHGPGVFHHALIGTPTELLEYIEGVNSTVNIERIKEVYVDDGDIIITKRKMLDFLRKISSSARIIYVSSTFNMRARKMMDGFGPINVFSFAENETFAPNVKHYFIPYEKEELKYFVMRKILTQMAHVQEDHGHRPQAMIFCKVYTS